MPKHSDRASKHQFLRQHGTLNLHPQDVTHELFRDQEFFDPEDLLQVKYEMLRQVRVDKQAIQPTARSFGLSRPSFYQAQEAFGRSGLAGVSYHFICEYSDIRSLYVRMGLSRYLRMKAPGPCETGSFTLKCGRPRGCEPRRHGPSKLTDSRTTRGLRKRLVC